MSETSVSTTSSRIKQFGLYRTIDARTEEFLRLSRKRQLRQGCACAAVSTAITVTIVVSVILIYEYGIISEVSSRPILSPNWLGLMNTSEGVPFEAKFNKASINLESSIPLLPLVLKALKKNRYYDNIMEEASTPNPLYENKETDDLSTKHFFSDTRNWMRIPTSRIYAIEYKTSPIIYYKSPTRNTDYFTKIRRIRDYQRIMNYVDKMISEKITGSTMPMLKNSYAFDKNLPIPYTTPVSINYKTKYNLRRKPKEKIMRKKIKCNCPKKINNLLNKMITVLHKLLPNATEDILKMSKPCHQNNKLISNVTKSSQTILREHINFGVNLKTYENSSELSERNNTFEVIVPNVTTGKIKKAESLLKSMPPKIDYTLQTIIKLIRPKIFRGKTMISDLKLRKSKKKEKASESTEDYLFSPQENTKPLKVSDLSPKPLKSNVINIFSSENFINVKDLDVPTNLITTLPTFYEEADDNYLVVTPTPNLKSFNSLDIHSLELIKRKMIPKRKEKKSKGERFVSNEKSKLLYSDNNKMFKNNSLIWSLLKKMGQLIKSKSLKPESITEKSINNVTNHDAMTNIIKTDYLHSIESIPPYSQIIQNVTTPLYITSQIHENKNEQDLTFKPDDEVLEDEEYKTSYSIDSITPYFQITRNFTTPPLYTTNYTTNYTTKKTYVDKNEQDLTFKADDVFEEEEDRTSYEEALTSYNLKKIEKIINLFNNSVSDHNVINIKPSFQRENIKSQENSLVDETTKQKTRSSYLEIQRNGWKHDEHPDYDNINNY